MGDIMNQRYNISYTWDQINKILDCIKKCVNENRFIISKNENRQENIDFINAYNLNAKKQKEILLGLRTEDFCHTLQNIKKGFEHELLYVFCPRVKLYNFDDITEELVDIYIKFNLIESDNGNRVIVVSFHKRNKPINYMFR